MVVLKEGIKCDIRGDFLIKNSRFKDLICGNDKISSNLNLNSIKYLLNN